MRLIESFCRGRASCWGLLISVSLFGLSCSKQESDKPKASSSSGGGAQAPSVAPIQPAPLISLGRSDEPDPATLSEEDKAWRVVLKACQPPEPPAAWQTQPPAEEEVQKWDRSNALLAGEAADKAKDFYTRYPNHAQAAEAKSRELEMLRVAAQLGNTNKLARLREVEEARLKDPALDEDERFELRVAQVQRAMVQKDAADHAAVLGEFEKGARELQKEFPKRPEPFAILLEVAQNSDADKARALAQEISTNTVPEEILDAAKELLKRLEAHGKPLTLKFKAVDGREVDLEKLKGKVVLVDFWATWCGPCVKELPNVKAAYEKLHEKGFEIVGISFDEDKDKLVNFTKKENMPWPQYFEAGGDNKFGREFNVVSIPTMWLVDKKGVLRDMNARGDLHAKVEKLLAEAQ
ncbi:MAG: redoxin domain-containing protein [Verrucomicrobia bacterium]|nr:redoxin domain-containing protein [Verrucomicrobiota bacterium]